MTSLFGVSQMGPRAEAGPLERIAALAARLLDAEWAALVLAGPEGPQVRACSGSLAEPEVLAVYDKLKNGSSRSVPWIEDVKADPRFEGLDSGLGFATGTLVENWDGKTCGMLVVADSKPHASSPTGLRHLVDLASLAGNELELDRRRARSSEAPDRRKTQEQLLDKTLELTKFGEDLRQIHRLSTTQYSTVDALFADHLEAGRAIFGLPEGVVTQLRGRFVVIRALRADNPTARPGATFELDRVCCGLVASQRRTIASSDVVLDDRFRERSHPVGGVQSFIGTPILVNDEIFGVLSFSAPFRRWNQFGSHEIEIIELMAKSIGRSIHEGRMEAERDRAETLEQDRSHALELMAKHEPLDRVLDQIIRMVERQSPALIGAIHLAVDGQLHCAAAPGMPGGYRERMQNISIPKEPGCCFSPACTRRTEIFDSAPRCHRGDLAPFAQTYCWQACGASPILGGSGELLGLLSVYWRIAVQPRLVDRELLEAAGHLAAVAIEHRRLMDRLAYQAQHDTLTGLANRRAFTERLQQEIDVAAAEQRLVGVVFVDLDRFKQINDHWGHPAGDAVLQETAARLRSCLREGETAARLGGDEFAAVLKNVGSEEEARARSLEILDAVRQPIALPDHTLIVTASVGLSTYPVNGGSAEALISGADQAMYRVKNTGKNGVELSVPELQDARSTRLHLEHSLRQALANDEFRLYFQPVVGIRRGEGIALAGLEVLLGWNHPTLGRIGPAQFIPIAEECGLIAPIGAWVLREACRKAAEWRSWKLPAVRIAVNVSPVQFARTDFVSTVENALRDAGLSGSAIEIELTESTIIENIDEALEKMERLRQLGVSLALDDFGSGYSSLSYLRWMPVQHLKIDRTFLAEMEQSANTRTLVHAIVGLAHNMGLEVVAEGVETETQLEYLLQIGCDKAQGHLFGSALAVEEVEQWLMRESVGVSKTK